MTWRRGRIGQAKSGLIKTDACTRSTGALRQIDHRHSLCSHTYTCCCFHSISEILAAVPTTFRGNPRKVGGRYRTVPIDMKREKDNIYLLEMWGQLRKSDLKTCEERLAGEINRVGPVKLLFNLAGFEGWETRSDWNDLTFYIKHGDSVQQIAIVGDDKWKSQALMFAGAGLRKAPVEYFPESELTKARTWLSS